MRVDSPKPWVSPITLEGRFVRLEPLALHHAAGLFAAAEPELFRFTPQAPLEWSVAGFEQNIQRVTSLPDVVAFAVILRASDTRTEYKTETKAESVIGRTTFMAIDEHNRGVEIGRTWIARAQQGTQVNPEMKLLMMQHAFEHLSPSAIRVQLTTGLTNEHSQRAIAKLGAVREGVLRRHRILPDGTARDTVVFSVIAEEWPAVKAGLERRIGLRSCCRQAQTLDAPGASHGSSAIDALCQRARLRRR